MCFFSAMSTGEGNLSPHGAPFCLGREGFFFYSTYLRCWKGRNWRHASTRTKVPVFVASAKFPKQKFIISINYHFRIALKVLIIIFRRLTFQLNFWNENKLWKFALRYLNAIKNDIATKVTAFSPTKVNDLRAGFVSAFFQLVSRISKWG